MHNVILEGRGLVGFFERGAIPELQKGRRTLVIAVHEQVHPTAIVYADSATSIVPRKLAFELMEFGDLYVYRGSDAEDFILGASPQAHRSIGFTRSWGKHQASVPESSVFALMKHRGQIWVHDQNKTPPEPIFPL